ncbi:O-antigen ligase family protein [Polaromonas sp.]|uniref:O-antigen ligase family protein n=1 Tax=Polaromonas sp. TaxID=1869339 RepID=UPI002487BA7D|nr:O-antigen ligase family protein [Polaromonas sp.]MDI1273042.1 hypothetical protein [Polaromonas sp.]
MSLDQQSPVVLYPRQGQAVGHRPNKLLFGLLFSFYLALSLARFVWPAQLLMSFVLSTLGLLALVLTSKTIEEKYLKIYSFIGLFLFSFLVSSLFVSARTDRLGHVVLFILANAGIALLLVKGCVPRAGAYFVFYTLAVCFVALIVTGVDARDALTATSYNGISMMLLAACISLYIVLGVDGGKIDLKPALVTALLCIWAIGRSGILSSVFLLGGLALITLQGRIRSRYVYIFVLGLVFFFAYLFFDNLGSLSEDNVLLGNAVDNYSARSADEESPRLVMWGNYLNNLDFFRLVFGANIFTDPWPQGEEFGYNYHNSWISLHSQTGLMGLVVIALVGFSLLKFWKNNKLFFVLFSAVIIRWSTDTGIFFESWDFLVYFFIFYYLSGKADKPDRRAQENDARPLHDRV